MKLIAKKTSKRYGQFWDENSTGRTYQGLADYHNDNYAKETFKRDAIISTYMIKDIRGSIEQQTGKKGYKGLTYQYTAFGKEKFPMNLNDIHGFCGYVRDRETDSYYVNARQYLPQIHRFMAKDKLRVDSLNRYLYVVNNPVNLVDLNGLDVSKLSKEAYEAFIEAPHVGRYDVNLSEFGTAVKDMAIGAEAFIEKTAVSAGAMLVKGVVCLNEFRKNPFAAVLNGKEYANKVLNNRIYQDVDSVEKFAHETIDKRSAKIVENKEDYVNGHVVAAIITVVKGGANLLKSGSTISSFGGNINTIGSTLALTETVSYSESMAVITKIETLLEAGVGVSAIKNGLGGENGNKKDCDESADLTNKSEISKTDLFTNYKKVEDKLKVLKDPYGNYARIAKKFGYDNFNIDVWKKGIQSFKSADGLRIEYHFVKNIEDGTIISEKIFKVIDGNRVYLNILD